MIDEHLFCERAGSLRVGIGEVASEVVECGLMRTGVAVDEFNNRAGSGGRSASVVFEKCEGDVVPVLCLAARVGGGHLCEQKAAEARDLDVNLDPLVADLGADRMSKRVVGCNAGSS